jgi:hypothetical protein
MPSELGACVICGYAHAASAWYYKASADGVRLYVRTEKLADVIDMSKMSPVTLGPGCLPRSRTSAPDGTRSPVLSDSPPSAP